MSGTPAEFGVSIIICTHNRSALLARTLESLSRMEPEPGVSSETIVVANACTDDSEQVADAWKARVKGLRLVVESTPGLSVARNRGAAEAHHGVLAFLDDDVRVSPGWLRALASVYRTTPAGLVAGRVRLWFEEVERPAWFTPGMEAVLSSIDLGDRVHERFDPHVVGANFSCRREVFDAAGPFRADLGRVGAGLGAGEESLFVRRALAAGHRLFYAPEASVDHWVPKERVRMGYLCAASKSVAQTIVRLRERFGVMGYVRTVCMGLARCVWHTGIGIVTMLGGRATQARRNASRVRRAIGAGQLLGCWDRMRFGPIR